MNKAMIGRWIAGVCVAMCASANAEMVDVDAALPEYQTSSGVSGSLNSIGSDTLNNLMAYWAGEFKTLYPRVEIGVEGKGSSTAPPALIEGTAQLGPMSRAMKSSEIDAFEKKYGHKPLAVRVAIDALAVFIHKDNPVKQLTMKELDAIFSATRKRGGAEVAKWSDVGATDKEIAPRAFSVYGRNSASGTYGFFKELVLQGGDFKSNVKEQPGSSAVVQGIAGDVAGIGYSGIGYRTSGVNTLSLGESSETSFEPTYENCLSGDYPLARFLYIYVNKTPGKPLDTLTREFLKFVLSKQGQRAVVKDGYFPIPPEVAGESLQEIE